MQNAANIEAEQKIYQLYWGVKLGNIGYKVISNFSPSAAVKAVLQHSAMPIASYVSEQTGYPCIETVAYYGIEGSALLADPTSYLIGKGLNYAFTQGTELILDKLEIENGVVKSLAKLSAAEAANYCSHSIDEAIKETREKISKKVAIRAEAKKKLEQKENFKEYSAHCHITLSSSSAELFTSQISAPIDSIPKQELDNSYNHLSKPITSEFTLQGEQANAPNPLKVEIKSTMTFGIQQENKLTAQHIYIYHEQKKKAKDKEKAEAEARQTLFIKTSLQITEIVYKYLKYRSLAQELQEQDALEQQNYQEFMQKIQQKNTEVCFFNKKAEKHSRYLCFIDRLAKNLIQDGYLSNDELNRTKIDLYYSLKELRTPINTIEGNDFYELLEHIQQTLVPKLSQPDVATTDNQPTPSV